MGEFDLSLIVEFRSRPSLYDRNSSQFKDKLFNAQQWQEISNKLGYDVSILKDRMLQLRNRYNLEKRRMEQLREESPGKFHESPWPLYESLQFLSEHIKARRRYKNMIPLLNPKDDSQTNDSGNEYSTLGPDDTTIVDEARDDGNSLEGAGGGGGTQPFPNGLFAVKVEGNYSEEQEQESDVEAECPENGAHNNHFTGNSNVMTEIHSATTQYRQQMQRQQQLQQRLQQQQQQQQQQNAQSHILPTRIIKRSLYNNNSGLGDHNQTSQMSTAGGLKRPSYNNVMSNEAADCSNFVPHKQARLSPRENKYNAFGNFISSSLLDLPQKMALELVEKFTSDVVKALTMKVENMEAAAAAAAEQLSHNDQ